MRLTAATFATALSLGVIALALPTGAVARSGATVDAVGSASIAHPALDFSAQQRRPRTYTPRTYTPPRTNTAPRYIYPGSRDALDTCAFC